MSDQTVSIASVLLGAGYQWDEGKVIADRLAALEYQDRFRLAAFIVGEPEAATPPALDVERRDHLASIADFVNGFNAGLTFAASESPSEPERLDEAKRTAIAGLAAFLAQPSATRDEVLALRPDLRRRLARTADLRRHLHSRKDRPMTDRTAVLAALPSEPPSDPLDAERLAAMPTRSRDAILALGDLLRDEHGESCDCDTCLAIQPIVDASRPTKGRPMDITYDDDLAAALSPTGDET